MEWAFLLILCFLGCLPLAAKPIEELQDGRYIFASQAPRTDRHPDVQLAGAEVYAFEKKGKNVLGEVFIANSSEASCFTGVVTQNFLKGRVIIHNQTLPFQTDLTKFHPVAVTLVPYARSSVDRCRSIVSGLR
ncbi:MAG: hypothetical protein RMK91_02030 [Pseudanabaenaceae cyanobacterium SKYGB_i_bin29]|nr:hypothetical protein [Pseudanabaenaceae cyanobacterium SKYG29]MDW8420624.1 hypothetical protein [Pseudanabaenaceae cyanobacterium SKYGB_i_bin29]